MYRIFTAGLLKIVFFTILLFGIFAYSSLSAQTQKKPSTLFAVYKIATLGENYYKSEDRFETQFIPSHVSDEVKKKIKNARKKRLTTESTSVRVSTRKIYAEDRIIIFRIEYQGSGKPYGRIYMTEVNPGNEDYAKPGSYFIQKYLATSFISDYYKSAEVMFDGMPLEISKKDPSFFDALNKATLDIIKSDSIKAKTKKATVIGVRG